MKIKPITHPTTGFEPTNSRLPECLYHGNSTAAACGRIHLNKLRASSWVCWSSNSISNLASAASERWKTIMTKLLDHFLIPITFELRDPKQTNESKNFRATIKNIFDATEQIWSQIKSIKSFPRSFPINKWKILQLTSWKSSFDKPQVNGERRNPLVLVSNHLIPELKFYF